MWLASSWSVLELCPFRWQEMTQFKSTISDSRTVPIAFQSFPKMWKLSVAVLKMATAEEQEVENGVKTWVGMGDDFSKKSSPMPTPFLELWLKLATKILEAIKSGIGMSDDFSTKSSPMPTSFFGDVIEASDEDPPTPCFGTVSLSMARNDTVQINNRCGWIM